MKKLIHHLEYSEATGFKREYERHIPGSAVYISAKLRLCPACPEDDNIHSLAFFQNNQNKATYTTLCRRCMEREMDQHTQATAVNAIASGIVEAARNTTASGTSFAEIFTAVCKPMGGTPKAMRRVGRILDKSLSHGLKPDATKADLDRAVKVGSILIQGASVAEKNSRAAESTSYSEEFIVEKCIDIMIENKGARLRVLNDPTVRRLLLKELGVDVLDGDSSEVVGG